MTAGGYSELADLEHNLWAANRVVQDTRFRATCAMSGQLAAAQQRTLGTALGLADPMKTFLGPELQGAPYPCTYPCKYAYPSTDSKVAQPSESKSRTKRPREPLVTFPNCEKTSEQLYQRNSFPELPEDLYTTDFHSSHSSHFATTSRKLSRAARHSPHDPAPFGVSSHHSQSAVQHHAAIAAFRPADNTSANAQHGTQHPRHPQTAPADLTEFPSDADVQCFVAALSARVEGLTCQQQASDVVALPFPGMHTLDLTFPMAQPALCEAAQSLLEHPRDFQAALMQCPLSQTEIRHPVIAADGYTYDAAQIGQWRQQLPAVLSLTSPLTRRPMLDRRLVENCCVQDMLQSVIAQRHKSVIDEMRL